MVGELEIRYRIVLLLDFIRTNPLLFESTGFGNFDNVNVYF